MRQRPLNPKAMQARYVRFRIALLLEGPDALHRFAAANKVTRNHVTHSLNGRPGGKSNRIKRSWRLEQAADRYIADVFRNHLSTLTPPKESP